MLNTLSKNVTIFKDCLFDFFLNIYLVMLTCMSETESSTCIGALLVRVAKYFMWKCLFRCIQAT